MNEVILKDLTSNIGKVLRLFREKSGRSQGDIAGIAKISISMLSQIERGIVAPSIDTLVMVCHALGLETADLFRRLSLDSPVRIHRPSQRLRTESGGVRYEQIMTNHTGTYPAEMFLLEVAPSCGTTLSSKGHEGVEMGYVLGGMATITVEGSDHKLETGDSVFFNSNLEHRLQNSGRETFRAIWSISPPHVDYLSGSVTGD